MPTLNWIGKDKVINHHAEVPVHLLKKMYDYSPQTPDSPPTPEGGVKTPLTNWGRAGGGVKTPLPNWGGAGGGVTNKIIHGDNLLALKALLPEYENQVKCIYIDPPYNTGNEGWVYNDNVNSEEIKKWLGTTVGKEAEDLTRHDKWLCMMYPRLVLLRKLLRNDGVIFISIDDNEQANLKLLCDEIFGAGNFVGTYFWYKTATPPNLSHKIKRNIEYILCYTKTLNSNKFVGVKKESKSDDPFTKPQNTLKRLSFPANSIQIKLDNQIIKKGTYGTLKFPNELLNDLIIENNTNKNEVIFENRFVWTQEKLNSEIEKGTKISINSHSLVLSYKKQDYANEVPPSLIDINVGVDTTENAGRLLESIFDEKVFDYPKPPSLIEYLINFVCSPHDIILDSFAGSGTTAHAVLNLNKADGGNRRFILVEMEDYAETITAERVRRVLQQQPTDSTDTLFADTTADTLGFSFYELGQPLLVDNFLNPAADLSAIRQYIWYTETTDTNHHPTVGSHPYLLGNYLDTAYYFYYEHDRRTCLDYDFLGTITEQADNYLIYADTCRLSEAFLEQNRIRFKKIPRDITQL